MLFIRSYAFQTFKDWEFLSHKVYRILSKAWIRTKLRWLWRRHAEGKWMETELCWNGQWVVFWLLAVAVKYGCISGSGADEQIELSRWLRALTAQVQRRNYQRWHFHYAVAAKFLWSCQRWYSRGYHCCGPSYPALESSRNIINMMKTRHNGSMSDKGLWNLHVRGLDSRLLTIY